MPIDPNKIILQKAIGHFNELFEGTSGGFIAQCISECVEPPVDSVIFKCASEFVETQPPISPALTYLNGIIQGLGLTYIQDKIIIPEKPEKAENWLKFGQCVLDRGAKDGSVIDALPGDICVFSYDYDEGDDGGDGHVGLFWSIWGTNMFILGVDQDGLISINDRSTSNLLGVRQAMPYVPREKK